VLPAPAFRAPRGDTRARGGSEAGAVANLAAALKAAPAGEQPGPAAAALAVLGALAVDAEGREAILAAGAVASVVRLLRAPAPDLVRGPARAEHASEVYAGLLRAPAPDLICGPARTGHAAEAWGPGQARQARWLHPLRQHAGMPAPAAASVRGRPARGARP